MNYFIDFDHTLYNTPLLTRDMLATLANYISKKCNQDYKSILNELTSKFKRGADNIYDIYDLINFFASKYGFDAKGATDAVNEIIFNGKKYLFEDSIPFLKFLKKQGHNIYILSYNELQVYFQAVKIAGSGVAAFVDGIMPVISLKADLPFDFSQCIFIDDKPADLIALYNKGPQGIYRIRRLNDTYSSQETNLPIPEFLSLSDLQSNLNIAKNRKALNQSIEK